MVLAPESYGENDTAEKKMTRETGHERIHIVIGRSFRAVDPVRTDRELTGQPLGSRVSIFSSRRFMSIGFVS